MDSICHNPLFLEGHCQNQLCCAFRSSASSVVSSVDVAFIAAFLEGIQSFSAYCKPVAVDRMADRRGRAWNRQNWHCQRWTGVRKVMASVTNADISTLSSLLSRILGPSAPSLPILTAFVNVEPFGQMRKCPPLGEHWRQSVPFTFSLIRNCTKVK